MSFQSFWERKSVRLSNARGTEMQISPFASPEEIELELERDMDKRGSAGVRVYSRGRWRGCKGGRA